MLEGDGDVDITKPGLFSKLMTRYNSIPPEKKTEMFIGMITLAGSMLTTIICATYFATMKYAELDERVSLLEQNMASSAQQLQQLNEKLNHVQDKIEKTYEVVAFQHIKDQ